MNSRRWTSSKVRSPFGLWATVGNDGDWADSEGGYPRAFADSNYRFNP